jgi:hypothetical protein
LIELLEKHVKMMKEQGKKMDKLVVRHAGTTLSNISNKGSNKASDGEKNAFRKEFSLIRGERRLFEIFNYLHKQPKQSDDEKEVVDDISLCICRLLKADTPDPSYINLLVYVNEMCLSPTPTSGFDFPSYARLAWEGMIGANECLSKFKT